jgi:hydrogenase-4 component E
MDMPSLTNALLVGVLMLNLFALGSSRISTVIRVVAVQGALLSSMPLLAHPHVGLASIVMCVAAIVLKSVTIPWMLMHALRQTQIKREIEPLIGFLPSIILGALATGFALIFAAQLPLLEGDRTASLIVPASLATVFVGFILLTTRFKAITQILGYIVLENGVFIFGVLLLEAMPLIVEMGILLDLFVCIFVVCIIVNHISRVFSSLDTRRLTELKE